MLLVMPPCCAIGVWGLPTRLCNCILHAHALPVADCRFADYLAVAASYTYEEGEKDHPADAIYIRETTEEETKPKSG